MKQAELCIPNISALVVILVAAASSCALPQAATPAPSGAPGLVRPTPSVLPTAAATLAPRPFQAPTATPVPTRASPPTVTTTSTLYCDPDSVIVPIGDLSTPPAASRRMPPLDPQDFVPSLPEGLVEEWRGAIPYGEVPASWPPYWIFVMRNDSSRTLWLALQSPNDFHVYVYDSLPLPQLEAGEVFIPFSCSRYGTIDLYLSAIAARPARERTTDVRHAWRINPETNRLEPVPTIGMECGCFW